MSIIPGIGTDAGTDYETVEGWQPLASDGRSVVEDDLDGPDHPDYPPASDDLDEEAERGLLKPCGEENRVRKRDTDVFPWSAICFLIITKGGKKWRGTGFFISPDTVVTAGHCLYSPRSGAAVSVQVIPGRDDSVWPFGSVMAREFYMPDEWRRSQIAAFDYGAIKLPDGSLGERTGHFPIANLAADALRKSVYNIGGYPGDMSPSRALHYNGGPSGDVYARRLYYMLDTAKGASGSPVWVRSGDSRRVVGIHNYGHCPNKATRINDRVFADLTEWMKSD
jgi:V8-like Glu-specific endopeptidase